jgi:hypothetical protein
MVKPATYSVNNPIAIKMTFSIMSVKSIAIFTIVLKLGLGSFYGLVAVLTADYKLTRFFEIRHVYS